MLLAFRKSTGEVIPDFQSAATADVLIRNATNNGVPADDIEIWDVSKEEYWALEEATYGPIRAQLKAEEDAKNVLLDSKATTVKSKLKLSADDIEGLKRLLGIL